MLKRYLSVLLTIVMLLSTVTAIPTFAEEISTETIGMRTLATETFSLTDYNKSNGWGTQIGSTYILTEDKPYTGSGWASNWLEESLEGFVPTTTANISLYCALTTTTDLSLRSKVDRIIARKLAEKINFNVTEGKYEIDLDVKSTVAPGSSRYPFSVLLGGTLEAGYTVNVTDDVIVPYIKVGNNEAVTGTETTTLDGKDAGLYTKFNLSVELNADGNDVVTLSLTDKNGLKATVTTTQNVSGSSDIVEFDMHNAHIDNINVYGADLSAKTLYEGIDAENIASDGFVKSEYVGSVWGAHLANASTYAKDADGNPVITGTGFSTNWKMLDNGTLVDVPTTYTEAKMYTDNGSSSGGVAIRLKNDIILARGLKETITLDTVKYDFSLRFKSAVSGAGSMKPFYLVAGDMFEAGYEMVSGEAKLVPAIKVNGKTVKGEQSVAIKGGDTAPFNTLKVEVYPGIDCDDVIKVTITDYDGATSSVETSAKLSGEMEYMALAMFNAYIDDLSINKYDRSVLPEIDDATEDEGLRPLKLLASEEFSTDQYGKGWDTKLGTVYPAEGHTGTGWSSKWLMKDTAGNLVDLDDAAVTTYPTDNASANNGVSARFYKDDGAASIYRNLAKPIELDNTDGKYIFGVDVKTVGGSLPFNFEINENLTVGYNFNAKGKVVPFITVGDETFNAINSISIKSGGSTMPLSKFKVILDLNKNAKDTITVRLSTDGYNAGVKAQADIEGNCSTIGIDGAKILFDNIYVKGVNYGDYQTEVSDKWNVETFAEETFLPADYSNGVNDKNIANAYTDATKAGTGFSGVWMVKSAADATYRTPEDADGVNYYRPSNAVGEVIRVNGMPSGTILYRLFENAVNFKDIDGKYVFSVDVQNGYSSGKSAFRFDVGGLFSVGYTFASSTEGTPFIKVGNETVATGDPIELGPVTNDATNNYYMHIDAEAHLRADGDDIIKFIITPKTAHNFTNPDAEKVTLIASADLSGAVDYVAFDANNTKGAFRIDNIKAAGFNYTLAKDEADEYLEVLSADYKGAKELEKIEKADVREIVREGFKNYGFAFDNFDSYKNKAVTNNDTLIKVDTLNNGVGFDGSWTGDDAQIRGATLAAVAGYDLRGNSLNVSRKFATPVDLSVDGEYFVKVSAFVDATSEGGVNAHNFNVVLGDMKIGSKGSYSSTLEGRIQATVNGEIIGEDVYYSGRRYNDYIIHIVSSKDGEDVIEYYFANDDLFDAEDLIKTEKVTSDEKIDTITITSASFMRVAHVLVDFFNENTNDISVYNSIPDKNEYNFYSDYKNALENSELPVFTATDYYVNKDGSFEGFERTKSEISYLDGETYVPVSDIAELKDKDTRTIKVLMTYRNLGLHDDEDSILYGMLSLTTFTYDGKLMNVERFATQVGIGSTTNISHVYNFPVEDGWPEEIDYSKLQIKHYIFGFNSYSPLDYAHTFNNSIYGH